MTNVVQSCALIKALKFVWCAWCKYTNNDVSALLIFPCGKPHRGKKISLTHLWVLGAYVDWWNVIDDILDGPAIYGLPIAARYVAIESRTPDRRRCGWSRGRFRFGGYAFGSPCFRPLSLTRCETTGTRKVQGTRHPRVSFVRAYVSEQNKTLLSNLPQNWLIICHMNIQHST